MTAGAICDPRFESVRAEFYYPMNRQILAVGLDRRGPFLIDATDHGLGDRRSKREGSWFKAARE